MPRIEIIEAGTEDYAVRFIINGIHRFYRPCDNPAQQYSLRRDLEEIAKILKWKESMVEVVIEGPEPYQPQLAVKRKRARK